eukprot:m.130026 g.130026  ORF g.130026 m.130026 type:complete len:95 (+) comp16776_c2_seq1:2122-2406(+)
MTQKQTLRVGQSNSLKQPPRIKMAAFTVNGFEELTMVDPSDDEDGDTEHLITNPAYAPVTACRRLVVTFSIMACLLGVFVIAAWWPMEGGPNAL